MNKECFYCMAEIQTLSWSLTSLCVIRRKARPGQNRRSHSTIKLVRIIQRTLPVLMKVLLMDFMKTDLVHHFFNHTVLQKNKEESFFSHSFTVEKKILFASSTFTFRGKTTSLFWVIRKARVFLSFLQSIFNQSIFNQSIGMKLVESFVVVVVFKSQVALNIFCTVSSSVLFVLNRFRLLTLLFSSYHHIVSFMMVYAAYKVWFVVF